MDPGEIELMFKLEGIFMPYAASRRASLKAQNKRMVHYTSAENLFKIISSKTMWMRNTNCMADYSEVAHGYEMLRTFFRQHHDEFCAPLNACHAGIGEESVKHFDQWWTNIRFNTYICSISEHEDKEDLHGRLSMWRAFGRTSARAAMVMKLPEPGTAEGLRLLLSPVAYFQYDDVHQQLQNVMNNITGNQAFLAGLNRELVKRIVFMMLVSAAVSIKHLGFEEEKEWRVIYLPHANPSKLIKSSTEVIEGVPQIIYKIPLEENPDNDVIGVGLPTLVDRIIIGPTVYPAPMHIAFAETLGSAGVADPYKRVVVSGIPIRS